MVGRARQRRRGDHQETLGAGDLGVGRELVRMDEAVDGGMSPGRLQVLTDGDEVDAGGAHVVHDLHDLLLALAQPDHDARFAEQGRIALLHPLQQAQRMVVAGARSDGEVKARNRLQIVVEHVRLGIDHLLGRRDGLAQEVRRQDLDGRGCRRDADGPHHGGEVSGPAVV